MKSTRTSFFKRLINVSLSGTIDPYAYMLDSISETNQIYQIRINELAIKNNQGLGSLAFINMELGMRFSAKDFQSPEEEDEKESISILLDFAEKVFKNQLYDDKNNKILEYLISRGLNQNIIEQFKIGYVQKGSQQFYDLLIKNGFKKAILFKSG